MKKLIGFISCAILIGVISLSVIGCGDSDLVTEEGVQYKKITYTRNGISVEAYEVVGCDEDIEYLNISAEINNLSVLGFKKEAFLNHTSLKEIVIPDSISSISLFTAPFRGCTNIEKITAPFSDIMALFTDYGSADNNTEHTIPSSVHYIYLSHACTEIGYRDFYYCTNIREIHIPSSVTSIKDGTKLISVGVNEHQPDNNSFNNLPFVGCTSLSIYCEVASKPDGFEEYWNYIDSENYAKVYWNNY